MQKQDKCGKSKTNLRLDRLKIMMPFMTEELPTKKFCSCWQVKEFSFTEDLYTDGF